MTEINEFKNSLRDELNKAERISLYALKFDKLNVTARELKFGAGELKKLLQEKMSIFFNKTCENRQLEKYPFGDCKDTIEYRKINDPSLNERIQDLKTKLDAPDISYDSNEDLKFSSYVLKIVTSEGNTIYLFTKKNPISSFKNTRTYFPFDKSYKKVSSELVQLSLPIDMILFDDKIYFISLHMEKDMGLETFAQKQKEKFSNDLRQVLHVGEYTKLTDFVKTKNARSFKTFNHEKIEKLKMQTEKDKIAEELNIPLDENGDFVLDDENCKERFLAYLQDKLAKDVDD
ncbi:Kiwa anti-phage protein KwaB-like domain-containing protein, partial [Acidaminococcus timonensis]|uniref:Kiwa anti-phage protein KwaB-like domain-containing protein n=1 Tax=Acidaminococcus timonensis TaxID=1871002 RepID=UPI0026EED2BD